MILAGNLVILGVIGGLILSGCVLFRDPHHRTWIARLFNSRDPQVQLHLYFAMVSIFSLFFYTSYAVMVRGFVFDTASFGKAIGVTFLGVGISSVGHGLQLKEDGNLAFTELTVPASTPGSVGPPAPLLSRLCDTNDGTMEMHLFLGATAIVILILYTGYDLAYAAKEFQPFAYGQALAYVFAGVGAAGWGQGLQRKFQRRPKIRQTRSKPNVQHANPPANTT